MQGSLLTVIVPVYKVEPYLRRCLDSIINQTYRDLEIILVDDGSPDNCPAICDEYAAKDSRVKVIHQKNKGLSGARNAGLDVATGDYIAFVDSDDWIELNMYEVAIQKMNQEKLDLVAFGLINEYSDRSTISEMEELDVFVDKVMSSEVYHSVCKYVYRKQIFDSLRFEVGVSFEDSLIIADIYERANSFGIVDEYFYHYNCENAQSIVHSAREGVKKYTLFKGFQKTAKYCKKHNRLLIYEVVVAKIYRLGLWCYMQNLKETFLSAEQERDILNVLKQINNLGHLSKIRFWDRVKYWSVRHSLCVARAIAYFQK